MSAPSQRFVITSSRLLLLATLAAWGVASIVEFDAAIFLFVLVACAAGYAIARWTGGPGGVGPALFAVAYATRSAAALTAFYMGKGEAFWVGGVGSDVIAYYENSFLDFGEALFGFSYKGFIAYNTAVTHWAIDFDRAHYLCNLQGPLVAGALLAVLVYAVVRELRDARTALAVAAIFALHPALISISAVLLRDTIVGMFGWLALYLSVRIFHSRQLPVVAAYVALMLGVDYLLAMMRLQSMMVFAGLSMVAIYLTTAPSPARRGLPPALRRAGLAIAALGALTLVGSLMAGRLPPGLDASYLQSVVEYRVENASQGSLGAALASANPALATLMYTVLALITPFPFYAWGPESLGHPTGPLDYLVGVGGLVNQLLLGCAVVGLMSALRRRDFASLTWLACIVTFVALTILSGGDTVRYVAVHVFPLYLLLVVDGGRVLAARPRTYLPWVGVLVALYLVYETLKLGVGETWMLGAACAMLLFLAAFVIRGWRLAASRVARSPSRRAATTPVPATLA